MDHGAPEPVVAAAAADDARPCETPTGALRSIQLGAPSAPPALLIHGLPGFAEDFEVLAPLLAAELRTISVDRRGYGQSPAPDWTLDAQVAEFAQLLTNWGRPALVMGHSYGGMIAAALAARHPGLVSALVLTSPALCERGRERRVPPGVDAFVNVATKSPLMHAFQKVAFSLPARSLGARLATPSAFAPDEVDPVHLARVRDHTLQMHTMRAALHEGRTLLADGRRVDAELYAITAPTVVIHGRGDKVVSAGAGFRTAQSIPHAEHLEIDGGHMITVTRAEQVAAATLALAKRASLIS